ncbi:LOW QUALITY PROTEIN: hypothetical protein U9M48_014272 [Paspalum notatum var. saurae]|uniref:Retroviral polymerase SH3-like domain-containing protein n=1 Tax=Paspalum notatum var. saurae TaxID=547442 RepID=A0AAQ3T195_PASNO
MIRTTNDVMRTLLLLFCSLRAESLHTTTYLINRLPSTASPAPTPHHALFGTPPRYDHLRVFGCACYPNTSATAPHKLAPRSTRCVFLGYSPDHKGYRCFDLTSRRVLISRHVVFDESVFPFSFTTTPASDLELESLFPTDPVLRRCAFLMRRSRFRLSQLHHAWPGVPYGATRGPGGPVVPRRAACGSQASPALCAARAGLPAAHGGLPCSDTAAVGVPCDGPVYVTACGAAGAASSPSPCRPCRLDGVPPACPRAGSSSPTSHGDTAGGWCSSARGPLGRRNRRRAMEEEYTALIANRTWDAVPPPPGGNVVTGKWIRTHKRRADGTRIATRLVGFSGVSPARCGLR